MPTTLLTALTSESIATTLADRLMQGEHHLPLSAVGAFEQEPPYWRFEAWFAETPDLGDVAMTVRGILGTAADALRFEQKLIDDTDWVAKSLEDLPPVKAGRFVIHGAHDRHKVRANDIAVEIEATLAFGTGHHGTTLGCLLALERHCGHVRATRRKGARRSQRRPAMLDVGTGTGVLALCVAKALKVAAFAGDLDAEAVRVARENVKVAGLAHSVRVVAAPGTRHAEIRRNTPYPLVVANILAGPLVAIAPELTTATARGGTLILSGLLAWQARRVAGAYLARGFRLKARRQIGDWTTLVLVKR